MKVLKCQGCGSTDFYEENGYRICLFCGTKHLITRDDKNEMPRESEISLDDDVQKLLQKWKEDPERADKYAELILQIDPNNEKALQYLQKKNRPQESQISASKVLAIVFFSIVIIGVFLVAFMTCRF